MFMIHSSLRRTALVFLFLYVNLSAFSLATEPAAQPTGLLFASVKAYSLVLSFTTTNADGYLILKGDQPITFEPVDGTTYEKGQGLPDCKVFYVGANNILSAREILEGSEYYFAIFAYNGSGNQINYRQSSPLSGVVNTPASDAGSYYAGIDSSGPSFLQDLHNLINSHTQIAYVAYKSNIVPAIFERDTVGGQVAINCEYSNETTIYTAPFDFNAQAYNREHVLCKSWMQTAALYGASNLINYTEGSDYFNLLLTRSTPNQLRSNNPLGIVSTVTTPYGESKYGRDGNNKPVFEPKANRKGDAARAMMYEMISYDGLEGGWGLDELLSQAGDQDQNILKQWNQQDPPDKFERTKQEYINSLQRNRNPFIDHPEWARCINFDSIVKTNLCGALTGIDNEILDVNLTIYPNPAGNELNVLMAAQQFSATQVGVFDIYGRQVLQFQSTSPQFKINTSDLESGNYLLRLTIDSKSAVRKFLIVR
jgi:endonuclease I